MDEPDRPTVPELMTCAWCGRLYYDNEDCECDGENRDMGRWA